MRRLNRAARLAAQISLLVALMSSSGYLLTRTYVGDQEQVWNQGNVNELVRSGGPVTIEHIEWKLDSLQPYTRLVDDEGEAIGLGAPAGSMVMVATMTATPREGVYLKDGGFSCTASLRDDRGNVWAAASTSDWELPTSCFGNDEVKFELNKPGQVAFIYVVPAEAVSHVVGVSMETREDFRRVLITP
ncbi:hypothetical protein E1218_26045 [Kribbella turkmenica]|uniref:DUF4352 domain-containing protein n=1 Tax=Kribbella turkmenica TaxID=2530375 RepID=A0A4V2YE94_9ACTN|nr:hypothetical protein [Kribbella turkmenica]TDD18456.1 hypothetical protein E1218_26045 [Kribbella turkmenica]